MVKLDIGCGEKVTPGYIGVDYIKYNDNIEYVINLNKEKIPFNDNTIDGILCSHIIEHLDNPFDVIKEIHRVLKPGAELIIKVPYYRHYQAYHPHHKTYWSFGEFNIFNNSYTEFGYKWSKCKLDWNWVNQGEDKLLKVFHPIINKIIRKYIGIYERKLSLFFPVYELVFTLTK